MPLKTAPSELFAYDHQPIKLLGTTKLSVSRHNIYYDDHHNTYYDLEFC